jgi:SAM-dependent methyltransferase
MHTFTLSRRRALLAGLGALALPGLTLAQSAPQPVFGTPGKDAGWIPTPNEMVLAMLDAGKTTSADYVVDLGSGDGRIPILAAKTYGSRAMGIELNGDLVAYSQEQAAKAGLADRVKFVRGDIFETDFTDATVVTLFMPPVVLRRLKPKLLEMRPGTRILSYLFNMEDWEPDAWAWNEGMHGMLWIIPASVRGRWTIQSSTPDPQRYGVRLEQQYQKIDGRLDYGGTELPLFDARLEGDRVRFTALAGNKRHDFTGTVKGDTIEGQLHVTGEPERNFRAARG